MKFRLGFVSNSSTTSFCLYGAYVDDVEPLMAAFAQRLGLDEPLGEGDFYKSDMEGIAKKAGVSLQVPSIKWDFDGTGAYLGAEWKTVGDSETGAVFKAGIEAMLKDCFPGVDFEFGTYDEAWGDG